MGIIQKLWKAGLWCLSLPLPVDKKKVVFCSYYGRGYSDNPKAIAQAMLDAGTDAKLCWLVKDEKEAATLPKGIIPVPYDSPRRIFCLATARVWVDNSRKYDRFKKKNQFYLQTWHGFALKRIEKDAIDALPGDYERGALKDSGHTDLLLSNSTYMTNVLRRCYWYEGEIAPYGSPRNDVFFHPDPAVQKKVREKLGLPEDRKLLLYAPTFRVDKGATDIYGMDALGAREACEKRFGGHWSVLIRLHPNVAAKSQGLFPYDGDKVLDATMYPDMQELLCATDLLITDYSSSIFDYALSGKPCMQFALDMEAYRKDRNFYVPLDQLPFPLATNNAELIAAIAHFDVDAYNARWDAFRSAQGFTEDGCASRRCAQWIEAHLD